LDTPLGIIDQTALLALLIQAGVPPTDGEYMFVRLFLPIIVTRINLVPHFQSWYDENRISGGMTQVSDEHDRRLGRIEDLLEKVVTRLDKIDDRIESVSSRVDDLSGRVDDLSDRVDDLSGRVDSLMAISHIMKEAIDQVDDRCAKVEKDLAAFRQEAKEQWALFDDRWVHLSTKWMEHDLEISRLRRREA